MKKGIWLLVIIFLISSPFIYKYKALKNFSVTEDTIITIAEGETFYSLPEKFPIDKNLFKIYLKLHTPDFTLQKGNYNITKAPNLEATLAQFKKPISEDMQVTLLEGRNIYDIDIELTSKGLIQAGEYISYVTQCDGFCEQKYNFSFISDSETLEGFLYPDTYNINQHNFLVKDLVRLQLERFQEKVIDSGIISDMGSIEILDVINLASIVQKEANKKDNPEELAIIAGILKKRLNEGWQIGADATVCYAHKIATQNCTPNEVLKYLYDKNEYNTRQKTGLPRSAISNPEAEVIEATLKAQDSPYYYYLHDTEGQIHYARTDAEHIQNKNTYLQ